MKTLQERLDELENLLDERRRGGRNALHKRGAMCAKCGHVIRRKKHVSSITGIGGAYGKDGEITCPKCGHVTHDMEESI